MPSAGQSPPFDVSIPDAKKRIQICIDRYKTERGYDTFETSLTSALKVISARKLESALEGMEAHAVFEIEVVPMFCNAMGNMHGGAIATVADIATTMAIAPISREGFWEYPGVSRTLNVTYLSPAQLGTVIVIECMLRSIGSRLSAIQCTMKNKDSGRMLALAEHGKSALSPQKL